MTKGVTNIMDEYQTLYDNYVKERTDQQNKIKEQMEQLDAQMKQLEEQQEQLAQKDTVITSAVSAIAASGKSAAEIAALLNIPIDVVRKITEN
ncbi:MAG: hypothetical protein J6W06_00960 [Bacteroidales bacterium]|jgi:ATPase subunit of ABC transporter with duplicated ATPase domains|nr:hypothetical protein [Bacteroidales bacterium]